MISKVQKLMMDYTITLTNKEDQDVEVLVRVQYTASIPKEVVLEFPNGDGNYKFNERTRDWIAKLPFWDAVYAAENHSFVIDQDEMDRGKTWLAEHDKTCKYANPKKQGASGGRISYVFTSTTLGQSKAIKCACGATEGMVDVSDW